MIKYQYRIMPLHKNRPSISGGLFVFERGIVMTIGEYIRNKQPLVYVKLMAMCQKELTFSEITKLMGHAAYKRVSGVIRQIRQG